MGSGLQAACQMSGSRTLQQPGRTLCTPGVALQLRHHPWVALPEEGRDSRETESMELARMDDAPSLEKWTNELVGGWVAEC